MMVTTKTTISFYVPDEYVLSEKFKAQHPDWIEGCTSTWISFTKQDTYAVDVKERSAGMTARERQLWYWKKEMESCHRKMKIYSPDSKPYKHWKELYESAVRTFNELSGMNLKVEEGEQE